LAVDEPEGEPPLWDGARAGSALALRDEAPLPQRPVNARKDAAVKESIFIGSLPFRADEEHIRALFSPFGTVHAVELHADWIRPTHEPYALVEMESDDIEGLVDALDGKKIGRTYIRVHKRTAQRGRGRTRGERS
jgi:hypothetical protein